MTLQSEIMFNSTQSQVGKKVKATGLTTGNTIPEKIEKPENR
jgi:hypothetical protein